MKNITWDEVVSLLLALDCVMAEGAGSRVAFTKNNEVLHIHRPHPENTLTDLQGSASQKLSATNRRNTMSHILQYKKYAASVDYSEDDACYVGEVIGMNHTIIAFDGNTIDEAFARFKEMIDDHPNMCAKLGIEPEIPSTISISLPTDLYMEVSEKAEHKGVTVRKLIAEALQTV